MLEGDIVQLADKQIVAAPSYVSYTGPCLLPSLQPVRHCLHPFLSSRDAARLMQASCSLTASLLSEYRFVDRVFFDQIHDVTAVQHSLAFYARYRLRITQMRLPYSWTDVTIDGDSGRSTLPASLIALSLGQEILDELRDTLLYTPGRDSEDRADSAGDGCERERECCRWWEDYYDFAWSGFEYGCIEGAFNQPIPPGALPHGLRFLQFCSCFEQPLQTGSIPDTVEVLHFGFGFNQPLLPGHLPASLTHLHLGSCYQQPLLPGVLPAGLKQLHVGEEYNQPLQPGVLPAQLAALDLGYMFDQPLCPGVIPSSVRHLRLSDRFHQPLQPDSIPDGVIHLILSDHFEQQSPRVFPDSIHQLVLGRRFNEPLQAGSIPDTVTALVFGEQFDQPLQAASYPRSSLISISATATISRCCRAYCRPVYGICT